MTEGTGYTTRITLIARLNDRSDQEAWDRFVDLYSPLIFSWCSRFQLQESDAADVTQEVLLKLVALMRDNAYDPDRGGFRAWLKTITSNLARDLLRSARRKRTPQIDSPGEPIGQWIDPTSLNALTRMIEQQYERELVDRASEIVRQRVQPTTWLSYQGTAIEQRSAADVAAELNLPVSEVYVGKSRVIKMLREVVKQLDQPAP